MNTNRRIIVVLITLSALFLSLLVYLTYFTLFQRQAVAAHPFNRRNSLESATLRGSIYDTNGVVLARSKMNSDNFQIREYPYGSLYAHVIGYNSAIYGRSQLEASFNDLLVGRPSFSKEPEYGYNLTLTINHELQQTTARALGKRNGAAIAIDPKTGEILAMVSYPTFDPNDESLTKNWNKIAEDANSPLLARAVSGLYAPGSTFKIVTSAAAIQGGLSNETFEDNGECIIDGKKFKNYKNKAFGTLNLTSAFTNSSNVAFCEMGASLGGETLRKTALSFGFEKETKADIPVVNSRFPQKDMSKTDAAAAAIGQWNVLATPLQMAKVAGIIANDGVEMPTYLVRKATSQSGFVMYEGGKAGSKRVIPSSQAAQIKEMMVQTVKTGTATGIALSGVQVAGKTGTAENERANKEHAWFVGFAPANDPKIAVAVIVEYSGGTGSELAIPIAREMIRAALQ